MEPTFKRRAISTASRGRGQLDVRPPGAGGGGGGGGYHQRRDALSPVPPPGGEGEGSRHAASLDFPLASPRHAAPSLELGEETREDAGTTVLGGGPSTASGWRQAASPRRKATPAKTYSDRMIPSVSAHDLQAEYQLIMQLDSPTTSVLGAGKRKLPGSGRREGAGDSPSKTFLNVLRNEAFPAPFSAPAKYGGGGGMRGLVPSELDSARRQLFPLKSPCKGAPSPARAKLDSPNHRKYATGMVSMQSQLTLQLPRKKPRYISATPWKVLDAPELQDDFYLNLMDWSTTNLLAVGLNTCVYLWNAQTTKVSNLCDVGPQDTVTSVTWMQSGHHVAVGTSKGLVQLWDVRAERKLREFAGHAQRVGSMACHAELLSTGSRDRTILHRDVRVGTDWIAQVAGHKQEVCGLRWSLDGKTLASGGNDNKLVLWSRGKLDVPLWKFDDHLAAVKAIAWSPHQAGLLASGGGTADRHIRFWNTSTGQALHAIDTGSQVCNVAWSKSSPALVSTHGYSQNQVVVWNYPDMKPLATLTGHSYRVLYLAMSPCGQNIVTGAGDETLRFWNVFDKEHAREQPGRLGTLPVHR